MASNWMNNRFLPPRKRLDRQKGSEEIPKMFTFRSQQPANAVVVTITITSRLVPALRQEEITTAAAMI